MMRKGWSDNCIRASGRMRAAAAVCAVVIALAQCLLLWPAFAEASHGATAGKSLSVRVQYFGERGDLIREKARFSRSDLEAMGAQVWCYSNVTRVGTVMSMKAYGPEVMSIIEAAGIDPGSVSNVTFRTTDGYTRNFNVPQHLSGGRYYYPLLSAGYERNEDYETLTPLEGSLEGAAEVPSILALEFGATKAPGVRAEDLTMGKKETFRFCMGQTPLAEGQKSRPGEGGDVTSLDSVHSIYGMDVTLIGSPVEGIGIDPVGSDLKVGSSTKLTLSITGDELFADDFNKAIGKLTWSSSDPSIASVDQKGIVTIHKAGEVTITVRAENGMSASIVIHGTGDPKKTDPAKGQTVTRKTDQARQTAKPVITQAHQMAQTTTDPIEQARPKILMREISLGGRVSEEPPKEAVQERALDEDTATLSKQRDYAPGTAGGAAATAVAACGVGGFIRFRQFRLIMKGWTGRP